MVGARPDERTLLYPRSEFALSHGAGIEEETPSPREACAPFSRWNSAGDSGTASPAGASPFASSLPTEEPPRGGSGWAILDSNQGPPPYQSGALTN
jgi:hypothetical protein